MDALGDAITVILKTIYSLMWEGVSRYYKMCPNVSEEMEMPVMYPNYAKEMPNICPIYAQNM